MISAIVCLDDDFAIGRDNRLLANLPNDLKRFKEITLNKHVMVGRKTYESIIEQSGDSLPDRELYVITRDWEYETFNHYKDHVYTSISELLQDYHDLAEPGTELIVCGGSEIYKQMMPHVQRIYMTIIHHSFPDADSHFPQLNYREWTMTENRNFDKDDRNPYPYSFITLERRKHREVINKNQ